MSQTSPPQQERPRIEWVKVLAGALAAVSSAVLLSTLGAAGTLLGAALGSVLVSVMSSLYSQGIARSRARMREAQSIAMRRVGVAQAEMRRAARQGGAEGQARLEHAEAELAAAQESLGEDADGAASIAPPPEPSWREHLVALPWKRIALAAAAFFIIAAVAITAFELIAGRPVSSLTGGTKGGGTSWSRFDHGTGASAKTPAPSPTTTPTTSTSPTPSPTASATPSTEPTQAPSTEPASPTPSASASATEGVPGG